MEKKYSFRLVEAWTQYSPGNEEGLGSMSSPSEETVKTVIRRWENSPEGFARTLLENGIEGLEESCGNEEFSYELQVFKGGEWVALGFVDPV